MDANVPSLKVIYCPENSPPLVPECILLDVNEKSISLYWVHLPVSFLQPGNRGINTLYLVFLLSIF